jgi:hypothetical protein
VAHLDNLEASGGKNFHLFLFFIVVACLVIFTLLNAPSKNHECLWRRPSQIAIRKQRPNFARVRKAAGGVADVSKQCRKRDRAAVLRRAVEEICSPNVPFRARGTEARVASSQNNGKEEDGEGGISACEANETSFRPGVRRDHAKGEAGYFKTNLQLHSAFVILGGDDYNVVVACLILLLEPCQIRGQACFRVVQRVPLNAVYQCSVS